MVMTVTFLKRFSKVLIPKVILIKMEGWGTSSKPLRSHDPKGNKKQMQSGLTRLNGMNMHKALH